MKHAPPNFNVVSSHVVYRMRSEEGSEWLKVKLHAHGNRDNYKKTVRRNSSTAQFDIIKLLLSLAIIFWSVLILSTFVVLICRVVLLKERSTFDLHES